MQSAKVSFTKTNDEYKGPFENGGFGCELTYRLSSESVILGAEMARGGEWSALMGQLRFGGGIFW